MSQSFDEIFKSTVVKHFAFVTEEGALQFCGTSSDASADPRDRCTTVRYRSAQAFVDVVLTYITLGVFVYVWPVPSGIPDGDCCWDVRPTQVTNFDHYLQARFGDAITPLFPGLTKPKYLTDMYNEQPGRYVKLMSSRLTDAIEGTAARFAQFGREFLQKVVHEAQSPDQG
jgi:hypothetical protein